jgi:hypothetical protein
MISNMPKLVCLPILFIERAHHYTLLDAMEGNL